MWIETSTSSELQLNSKLKQLLKRNKKFNNALIKRLLLTRTLEKHLLHLAKKKDNSS